MISIPFYLGIGPIHRERSFTQTQGHVGLDIMPTHNFPTYNFVLSLGLSVFRNLY